MADARTDEKEDGVPIDDPLIYIRGFGFEISVDELGVSHYAEGSADARGRRDIDIVETPLVYRPIFTSSCVFGTAHG